MQSNQNKVAVNTNAQITENKVQSFKFGDIELQGFLHNGNPHFLGSKAAKSLGYAKPADAIRTHCKGVFEMETPSNGGSQMVKIINESNLYRLIFRSKLPYAERFQDWVVEEVLPEIRKTGIYINSEPKPYSKIELLEMQIKSEKEIQEKNEIIKEQLRIVEQRTEQRDIYLKTIEVQAPKIQYVDEVLQSESLYATTQLANDLGFRSPNALNARLKNEGVQRKVNGCWVLTAKYANKGYTKNKTQPVKHSDGTHGTRKNMYWLEEGAKFLHDFFNNK